MSTSLMSLKYAKDEQSFKRPVINSATIVVTLYLDTGASSNAVPEGSPIVNNIHDIPSRDVIGIVQEACTQVGIILEHFGSSLILPSLTVHLVSLSLHSTSAWHDHPI